MIIPIPGSRITFNLSDEAALRNPTSLFLDEETRRVADLAATLMLNRFTVAKRIMDSISFDADQSDALAAFNELSLAVHELHKVLMMGWWSVHRRQTLVDEAPIS